jgi:hypothetical protein
MKKNCTGTIWEEKMIKNEGIELGLSQMNKLQEKRKKYIDSISKEKH